MTSTGSAIGVGDRLVALMAAAYRLRMPMLLEGPSGIGKSDIVHAVARLLCIECVVLDLSLLEPPDLIGMPVINAGRTSYATPAILPIGGAGLLMLEELNRAEIYVQQPALQLLSARALHDYRLPSGWSVVAAINPDSAEFNVRPLDRAMVDRFLHVVVQADRAEWLNWATMHDVHAGVMALVRQHDHALHDVSPRRWAAVSAFLHEFTHGAMSEQTLLDALGGYLPQAWVAALWTARTTWAGADCLEPQRMLLHYHRETQLQNALRLAKSRGQTDALKALVCAIEDLLRSTPTDPLPAGYQLDIEGFERLLMDLPGDDAERLQFAFGENPANARWMGLDPADLKVARFDEAMAALAEQWLAHAQRCHRGWVILNGLLDTFASGSANERHSDAADLRKLLRMLLPGVGDAHQRRFRLKAQRFGVLPGYAP